jgi:DNA-binding CsgD family transcriptional regulator
MNDSYHFNGQSFRCRFYSHILRHNNEPLADITNNICADGVVDTIYCLIRDLKQQGRSIHLSITGGRRMMSSLAVSAALLHFKHSDHIWHIYTPDEVKWQVRDGTHMHVSPKEGVQLIEVPFVPWGTYLSGLPQPINTAQAARTAQAEQARKEQHTRCSAVVEQASSREKEILSLFAKGLRPQEVAERLKLSLKTIDTHKTKLLGYCHTAWDIDLDIRLDYHFLKEEFASFFEVEEHMR